MSQIDPYYLLGVPLDATPSAIRAAYRRRAAECHPDRQPPEKRAWASEQMIQLNAARDLLLDPRRRAEYDERMRIEMHKSVWRARRGSASPASRPGGRARPDDDVWRRPWRPGPIWLVNVLIMFVLLGLCAYSVPYSMALASAPESAVFQDPWFWAGMFFQLVVALARATMGPLFFAALVGLIIANLGRLGRQ